MERLTNREYGEISSTEYTSYCDACLDSNCHCGFVEDMVEKLAVYEDLEERLNNVYGDCDGLLLRVVEALERHSGIDIANNTLKSRLLTDEDVDKWEEYKQLEEQGRLLKLPCKVRDTVYCIFSRYTKCTFSNEEFDEYSCQGCEYECDSKKENYVQDMRAYSLDWIVTNLKNFGKTVFLTKSEAEARLEELRGNNE